MKLKLQDCKLNASILGLIRLFDYKDIPYIAKDNFIEFDENELNNIPRYYCEYIGDKYGKQDVDIIINCLEKLKNNIEDKEARKIFLIKATDAIMNSDEKLIEANKIKDFKEKVNVLYEHFKDENVLFNAKSRKAWFMYYSKFYSNGKYQNVYDDISTYLKDNPDDSEKKNGICVCCREKKKVNIFTMLLTMHDRKTKINSYWNGKITEGICDTCKKIYFCYPIGLNLFYKTNRITDAIFINASNVNNLKRLNNVSLYTTIKDFNGTSSIDNSLYSAINEFDKIVHDKNIKNSKKALMSGTGCLQIYIFNYEQGDKNSKYRQKNIVLTKHHLALLNECDKLFQSLIKFGEYRKVLMNIIENKNIADEVKKDIFKYMTNNKELSNYEQRIIPNTSSIKLNIALIYNYILKGKEGIGNMEREKVDNFVSIGERLARGIAQNNLNKVNSYIFKLIHSNKEKFFKELINAYSYSTLPTIDLDITEFPSMDDKEFSIFSSALILGMVKFNKIYKDKEIE